MARSARSMTSVACRASRIPRPQRCFASGAEPRRRPPAFPGQEGGGKDFFRDAEARGFEEPELSRTTAPLPHRDRFAPASHAGEHLPGEGKRLLRTVQTVRPAADSGGIGQAIRVFEIRQCLLPRAVLYPSPPPCLTVRQPALMRVRQRKQREEGEGRAAARTGAATDLNPVMILVVRLLAAASMTDGRTAFTDRALA